VRGLVRRDLDGRQRRSDLLSALEIVDARVDLRARRRDVAPELLDAVVRLVDATGKIVEALLRRHRLGRGIGVRAERVVEPLTRRLEIGAKRGDVRARGGSLLLRLLRTSKGGLVIASHDEAPARGTKERDR